MQFRGFNSLCGTVSNEESYLSPFFATSLRDLWSRRWNGMMKDLYRRLVFVPLRSRGVGAQCAALSSFIFSGLLHDFWNYLAFGTLRPYQTAFFLVQGFLVTLELALGVHQQNSSRCSRLRGTAITQVVLTASGILFFYPYAEVGLAKSFAYLLKLP